MRASYKGKGGEKKAKQVFYASINAGKITGAERPHHHSPPTASEIAAHKNLAKEVAGGLRQMRLGK